MKTVIPYGIREFESHLLRKRTNPYKIKTMSENLKQEDFEEKLFKEPEQDNSKVVLEVSESECTLCNRPRSECTCYPRKKGRISRPRLIKKRKAA